MRHTWIISITIYPFFCFSKLHDRFCCENNVLLKRQNTQHSRTMTTKNNPTCNTCNQGQLQPKKTFRLSGPVVAIGYIFLMPSICGILFGALLLFSVGSVTEDAFADVEAQYARDLQAAGLSAQQIESARANTIDLDTLTDEQYDAYTTASLALSGGTIGTGAGVAIGGGMSIGLIIFSFCSGLIGWLLVMKKNVLQCTNCSAIVAAS